MSASRLAALVLLGWAALAEAAPRITVAPITGDRRAQLQSQLSATLCRTYTCVPSTRVFTRKKPDWAKVKSNNVQGLLLGGTAKAKGGGRELQLLWLTRPGKPSQTWAFPLTKQGRVTASSLQTLSSDLGALTAGDSQGGLTATGVGTTPDAGATSGGLSSITGNTSPPPSSATAGGQMTASPPPEPLPLPVTPTPPPAGGDRTLADTPVVKDAGEDRVAELPRHQWRFAVEAGADLLNRNLSFDNNVGLRPYTANLFVAPHARLEVFPIAFFNDGLFAGIGLFGDYTLSIGLKSKLNGTTDGSNDKNSSYTRWQAGLEWRLRFWRDSDFAIVPYVAYTKQKFVTDGDPTTIGYDGLPQFDLKGIKGGLRLDVPVSGSFWIIVGADYVKWSTKDVAVQGPAGEVKQTLTGSGHAIEAELGLQFGLFGPLYLRVFGTYSSTAYTFDANQTDAAGSATDRYLGGRVMLRAQF